MVLSKNLSKNFNYTYTYTYNTSNNFKEKIDHKSFLKIMIELSMKIIAEENACKILKNIQTEILRPRVSYFFFCFIANIK